MDNFKKVEDIKKQNELIKKLKDIHPTLFKDGILDFDQLKLELGLVDQNLEETNEKYGLNWVGKKKAYFETTKTSSMTLVPQRDKSMNFDESDNIIIEGDNLEVLRLLEKSYFNKVDVIYIDPPYNTGNDFVYNDDRTQNKDEFEQENNIKNKEGYKTETKNTRSDGRFHTNWLNMMYPRLRLARNLLKEDGVIFISIDDNEQARLKLMCDEIFGEQNFVTSLIWVRNPGGESDNNYFANTKDFILVYGKSKDKFILKPLFKEMQLLDFKISDNMIWKKGSMLEKSGENDRLIDRPNLGYTIWYNPINNKVEIQNDNYERTKINEDLTINTKIYEFYNLDQEGKDENGYFPIIPRKIKNTYGCWRKGSETFLKEFYEGKYIFELDKQNNWRIYEKEIFEIINPYKEIKPKDFVTFTTNSNGTKQFKEIFPDYLNLASKIKPKPIELVLYLINLHKNKNSLILDFFAGSGTTGQAVMELNKEDGGNRKFILVQLDEQGENLENTEFETIADITRERIKRSIKMYDYKEKGFKAFKLQDSNLKSFDAKATDSVDAIQQKLFDIANKIKDGATTEDLIYEIILRVGKLPLDIKIHSETIANNKVYFDENKYFIFMLEPTIGSKYYENILDVIKQIYKDTPIHVFLNDSYFKNDQDKINFSESIKNIEKNDAKIEIMVI